MPCRCCLKSPCFLPNFLPCSSLRLVSSALSRIKYKIFVLNYIIAVKNIFNKPAAANN